MEARTTLRECTFSNPAEWLFSAFGITQADLDISSEEAMKIATFFCCVKIIAEDVSSLPLMVMKRMGEGSRKKGPDPDHPLYTVIHDQANPEMTAMSCREAMTIGMAWQGNGYAQIVRDKSGNVMQLWPLYSHRMQLVRDPATQTLRYKYTPSDGRGQVTLNPQDVLHVPGLSLNGLYGLDIVTPGGRALALARAAEVFAQKYFERRSVPSGYISIPGEIEDHGTELSKSWTERTAGEGGIHGTPVLENSFEFRAIPLPDNQQAQMIETRQAQNLEVIRLFRMPPNKVGDWTKATYNNYEQAAIEYVGHTLRVWLVRWEQAILRCCISPIEQRTWFVEHAIEGLLRGDIKTRYESYATGINWGWLIADDVRELENMNPLPDGQGQVVMVPANMIPVKVLIDDMNKPEPDPAHSNLTPQPPLPQGEGEDDKDPGATPAQLGDKRSITSRERLMLAYAPLLRRDAARVVRREREEISKASRRYLEREDLPSMVSWVLEFYASPPSFIPITLQPVVDSLFRALAWDIAEDEGLVTDEVMMQTEIRSVMEGYAQGHTEASRVGIMTLLNSIDEGHAGALDAWLAKQEESRPAEISTDLVMGVGKRVWGWTHPERAN
jgi:HK97 family phage portal protein